MEHQPTHPRRRPRPRPRRPHSRTTPGARLPDRPHPTHEPAHRPTHRTPRRMAHRPRHPTPSPHRQPRSRPPPQPLTHRHPTQARNHWNDSDPERPIGSSELGEVRMVGTCGLMPKGSGRGGRQATLVSERTTPPPPASGTYGIRTCRLWSHRRSHRLVLGARTANSTSHAPTVRVRMQQPYPSTIAVTWTPRSIAAG